MSTAILPSPVIVFSTAKAARGAMPFIFFSKLSKLCSTNKVSVCVSPTIFPDTTATAPNSPRQRAMVSTIPYPSIKAVKIEGRRAYPMLVLILLTLVVVLLNHEAMLFGAGIAYLVSGPVLWWMERKNPKAAPETPGEPQQEHVGDVR